MAVNENQLELFDVGAQPASKPHREMWGRFVLQLRHDQLILVGIFGLIGLTVIFACGVERGKQLLRGEHVLLAHQQPEPLPAPVQVQTASERVVEKHPEAITIPHAPAKAPEKGKSRYIIQVVTYSQPQLATQELQRLQARGERAFLLLRAGRATVNVGPFPSRDHATKKLVGLKTHYQDCFVKTL